jgi:hypothetical protein
MRGGYYNNWFAAGAFAFLQGDGYLYNVNGFRAVIS